MEPAAAPLTSEQVYQVISTVKPENAALVNESTSTMAQQLTWCPTTRSHSFFCTPSGGIGWGVPAAVGIALGDRERGVKRHVVATIGDGSFQYSVQAIWTAAQHDLPIIFVVLRNGAYEILKSFALLEKTPNVPGSTCPVSTSKPPEQVRAAIGHRGRHRGTGHGVSCRTGGDRPHRDRRAHHARTAVPRLIAPLRAPRTSPRRHAYLRCNLSA